MAIPLRCLLIGLLLAGCQPGTGTNTRVRPVAPLASPGAAVASARAGALLAPGTLAGRVGRYDGQGFVPAPGLAVKLDDGAAEATTDAEGHYGFANVAAGVHRVAVATEGHHPCVVAFRASALGGLGRVNLALVPVARPAGLGADALAIAGVIVDPRGAAIPGGTVRLADSLTAEGNRAVQADADGFWVVALGGLALGPLTNGQATLTAHGATPGEVKVESTEALTLPLDGTAATVAVVAATRAYTLPRDLRWVEAAGRRRVLAGSFLPTRRDELTVRWARPLGYSEGLPAAVEAGRVVLEVPPGTGDDASVELLPLGLVPPEGKPPALSLGAPVTP